MDSEELAEVIEQRQSEAGVAAQLDGHAGKSALQSRHQPQQHGHDAGVTGSIARSQTQKLALYIATQESLNKDGQSVLKQVTKAADERYNQFRRYMERV